MDRKTRRENLRLLEAVKRKAKKDMQDWMLSLPELPSEGEVKAFQAGYIAGVNRGSQEKSDG